MCSLIKYGFAVLLSLTFPVVAHAAGAAPGRANGTHAPSNAAPSADKVARYIGTSKGQGWGMPAMILHVQMPPDGKSVNLIVPNENPMGAYDPSHVVTKVLEGVKPGDLLSIQTQTDEGQTSVVKISVYDAKPGENEPNTFIFEDASTDGEHPTVTLTRFGEGGVLAVATKRNDTGKMAPDADVLGVVKSLKKGDVVIARLKPGRVPTLASLELFTPAQTGTFVKMTNTTIDGQPHPAIEIKTDAGADETVLLPGTANKAGKWSADLDLMKDVHRLRAKSPIEYRTAQAGDQTVLKDIAVGKAAPPK